MNRRLLIPALVLFSGCDPSMKAFMQERAPAAANLREQLKGAVAAVEAQQAVDTTKPCTSSEPLVLNVFPSNHSPDTGNTGVVTLDDARAAAAATPNAKSSTWSSVVGGGEQALLTTLHWAQEPIENSVDKRTRRAIEATFALKYVVLLRDNKEGDELSIEATLVDLRDATVVCARRYGTKYDGAGTDSYQQVERGTGLVKNTMNVGESDRAKAAIGQQLKDSLRGDFKIRW